MNGWQVLDGALFMAFILLLIFGGELIDRWHR